MDRLTWTKEQRKEEGIGLLKYLSPEMCAKWDERLSTYEDADLLPAEITAMKDENARLRAELEAAKEDLLYALENSDSLMSCEPCTHRGYHPEDGMYCKLKSCRPEWRGMCPANTPAQEGEKQ